MKAVILAGGLGTRLAEETHLRPKPMVEVGGKPILWHILKTYSHHGINDFVICCGYKGYVIKEYFANYFLHTSDVTFHMDLNHMEVHRQKAEPWKVALPPHPAASALPSPQPSAPEMAPLLAPFRPAWLAPRGGPVFVSPPDQFSLSPDTAGSAAAQLARIVSGVAAWPRVPSQAGLIQSLSKHRAGVVAAPSPAMP